MSRHGKIAANKTLLSVNIERTTKEALAELAGEDRRTLSSYVALKLEEVVELEKAKRAAIAAALKAGASDAENPQARRARGR